MTTEEAIKTIEIAIAEVEWDYPMEYAVAFEMAIAALKAQQEAEKNEPLTLEELREMEGEPVWMQCIYAPKFSEWEIVVGVDTDFGGRTLYCAGGSTFRNYGVIWLAYRHKPKEGTK